ncbi:SIS domain-containing protein [Candidatus Pacearchaeota archaeon]|nr:SIS domain-containing protein [Candidatus Pacearchaeota archaeon]
MPVDIYNKVYDEYFKSNAFLSELEKTVEYLKDKSRIFFIGNGGSNAICSHMMEDFAKLAGYQSFTFSDPALITCLSNDYGYENAMMEWCRMHMAKTPAQDVLVAISSSGNSMNIINAVDYAKHIGAGIIALSGFDPKNKLNGKGDYNFHIAVKNYGVVECFHQVILHMVLDKLAEIRPNPPPSL